MSKCPVHGAFPSRMLRIDGAVENITFSGNSERCPTCGRPSAVMEGTFTIRDGLVEVLSAPQWTRDMLERAKSSVRRTAEAIQRDDWAAALSAIIELQQDQANLANLIRQNVADRPKNRALKFLAGVMLAVGIISDAGGAASTVGEVITVGRDTITSIVKVLDQQGEPTGNPATSPEQNEK